MPGTVADVGHTDAMPACKENHTLSHLCWVQPDYISQPVLQLCGHVTEHGNEDAEGIRMMPMALVLVGGGLVGGVIY